MRRFISMVLVILAMTAPSVLDAQTTISARGASLRIGGRLHMQYAASSVDGAVSDFFVRRARILMDGTFTDFVSGRVQVDFKGGGATLLDAYVTLGFSDALQLQFGQFKRAFDIMELHSSTDLPTIERAGKIEGYSACTGVGGACTLSRLTEELGFSDRDVGVRAEGASGAFSYIATVTNGEGPVTRDVNNGKSFSGRAGLALTDGITVSANAAAKDYLDPADETAHAYAWGADVEMGAWRDGLHVLAGLVGGENWLSLATPTPGEYVPGKFLAAEGMVSFYVPIDNERLVGIEPMGRVSIADPDDSIDQDGGWLVTPGFMVYFMGKNRIGFNYDYYKPHGGDGVSTLRIQSYLYF